MRLLVVTHDYPPPVVGGYGTMATDVCGSLASRGHVVHVLTTNQPETAAEPGSSAVLGPSVTRSLRGCYESGERIYPALRDAIAIERHNLACCVTCSTRFGQTPCPSGIWDRSR